MQDKRKIIIGIIFVVVVAAVGIYLGAVGGKRGQNPSQTTGIPGRVPTPGQATNVGTVVAPNASPINDKGQVVTPTGQPTDNSATPGMGNAPTQSAPISKDQIPSGAIKMEITTQSGFKPNSFTVKAGSAVIFALTSGDDQTHVLRFDDPSLNAVAIGIGPQMTRLITFNAPQKPGEYTFHDDVPGHQNLTGKMIVQ
jgi:Copper binding proteins, plastocyanin/azurin family.